MDLPWELMPGGEAGILPALLEFVGQGKYTAFSRSAFDELRTQK